MPKNGLNDLKFGHNKNYDDFNRFQKNWQNLAKNVDFLAENQHFFFLQVQFFISGFRQKVYAFPGKWSNSPNFWYICSLEYLPQ